VASIPETRPSLLIRLRDSRNQHAWAEFLQIYEPLISRVVRQRGIQPADVSEVTQEVLMAVARSIHRWESDPEQGSFRGWLSTITRNLVVNFLIKQARHPRGSGNSDFHRWLEDQPAPEGEISEQFDIERKRQTFRYAAEQVRGEFRAATWQAFWATAVENRTVTEVSAELGVSPGMIYVSRSRVMKRLREAVEQIQQDELLSG